MLCWIEMKSGTKATKRAEKFQVKWCEVYSCYIRAYICSVCRVLRRIGELATVVGLLLAFEQQARRTQDRKIERAFESINRALD